MDCYSASNHHPLVSITPAQIRAARMLAGKKQSDLAQASGVSLTTIKAIEANRARPLVETIDKIEAALRGWSVECFETAGEPTRGRGVRFLR